MGNLAAKLQQKTKEALNHKQDVINEIVDGYRKYLNNIDLEENFDKSLQKEDIIRGYKKCYYSFWAYHEGCSGTNFRLGGYEWNNGNGYGSHKYKDVELREIQQQVLEGMFDILRSKLSQIGLHIRSHEYGVWFTKNNLGYINDYFEIYW